jgi:hypothetical protein
LSTAPNQGFRLGNRPLDFLTANRQPLDRRVAFLVELIPKLSDELLSQARKDAMLDCFTGATNGVSNFFRIVGGAFSGRQTLLAQCIFDLVLTVYFYEAYEYCGDREVASLLSDALLYQATGCEPSSPTESQIREGGTHGTRGICKFALARKQMGHIPDITAWIFGREVAELQGRPRQIGIIVSIAPVSLVLRTHAKWTIHRFLYGTQPTEADMQQLNQDVAKMGENAFNMFKQDA